MTRILNEYFFCFLHPIRFHESMAKLRETIESRPIGLVEEEDEFSEPITVEEAISVSWIFVIFQVFYGMIALLISMQSAKMFWGENDFLLTEFSLDRSYATEKFLVFVLITEAVFFPLIAFTYYKVWRGIISFLTKLFSRDDEIDENAIEQVVASSISANVFLIVPVFGSALRIISGLFYLFIGLKKNLGFTYLQSIFTIFSPFLIISTFWVSLAVGIIFFAAML